jgi:uncharacterized protein (DUF488 family)
MRQEDTYSVVKELTLITLCSLVFIIKDNGQNKKTYNSKCYTQSSEPFRNKVIRVFTDFRLSLWLTVDVY